MKTIEEKVCVLEQTVEQLRQRLDGVERATIERMFTRQVVHDEGIWKLMNCIVVVDTVQKVLCVNSIDEGKTLIRIAGADLKGFGRDVLIVEATTTKQKRKAWWLW